MTIQLPIERDGVEVIAEVTLYHERASRGARDSLGGVRGAGPPLEPDEPEIMEYEDSTIDLTEAEKEQAVEMGWKEIYD